LDYLARLNTTNQYQGRSTENIKCQYKGG